MSAAIYHPSLYDRQTFRPCYWAATVVTPSYPVLADARQVEVASIGGGHAGLSNARQERLQ